MGTGLNMGDRLNGLGAGVFPGAAGPSPFQRSQQGENDYVRQLIASGMPHTQSLEDMARQQYAAEFRASLMSNLVSYSVDPIAAELDALTPVLKESFVMDRHPDPWYQRAWLAFLRWNLRMAS